MYTVEVTELLKLRHQFLLKFQQQHLTGNLAVEQWLPTDQNAYLGYHWQRYTPHHPQDKLQRFAGTRNKVFERSDITMIIIKK